MTVVARLAERLAESTYAMQCQHGNQKTLDICVYECVYAEVRVQVVVVVVVLLLLQIEKCAEDGSVRKSENRASPRVGSEIRKCSILTETERRFSRFRKEESLVQERGSTSNNHQLM